jgi:hypothetical protein
VNPDLFRNLVAEHKLRNVVDALLKALVLHPGIRSADIHSVSELVGRMDHGRGLWVAKLCNFELTMGVLELSRFAR